MGKLEGTLYLCHCMKNSKVEVIGYLVNRVVSWKQTLRHIVNGKVLKLGSISFNFPTVFLIEKDIAIHCAFFLVHVLTRQEI
jgi:hypothetical protein